MRTTPLTEWHRKSGAKTMEFGGFEMPIEYSGIIEEHNKVRTEIGMFDVSHMGEFTVEGPNAAQFLDHLVTNRPSALDINQALYTPMCYPDGGTVDDLLIYRLSDQAFYMVVNAGNYEKDWAWITGQAEADWTGVALTDISLDTALIAVQGPEALTRLQPLTDVDLDAIGYYHALQNVQVAGIPVRILSRTGYTGEDGFELYVAQDEAEALWTKLSSAGISPIGLGARDTLRLEARLPLYGHELSSDISPLEAGLGIFVKWEKDHFVGREALWRQKSEGLSRRVVGLEVTGGIARAGYPVKEHAHDSEPVGSVTSGSHSPTLKKSIALALVPTELAKIGTLLFVEIRGRNIPATVVKTPFYKRSQPKTSKE